MALDSFQWMRRFPDARGKIGAGALAVCLVAFVTKIPEMASRQSPSDSGKAGTISGKRLSNMKDVTIPSGPPPKFRLYRFGTDVPTSYVVSQDATDEQLRRLLWFFREKVRTGAFKDIGITQPTTAQFGPSGYAWGMLTVFRGETCANEYFISDGEMYAGWTVGFCGPGEHNDAGYHWGIEGDPLKDSGTIKAKNGSVVEVFSYKDNWRPSSRAGSHSMGR